MPGAEPPEPRLHLVTTPGEAAIRPAAGEPASASIAVPAVARFSPALRHLALMLPILDINGAMLAGAAAFASVNGAHMPWAGVFAVDPFLVITDLEHALRAGGFCRVTNFPTVRLLDARAGAGLAAVGYDLVTELRVLAAFRDRGFDVTAHVTDPAGAHMALAAGFTHLAFHPAFRPEAMARDVLREVAKTAQSGGATLACHAPP